MGHEDGLVDEGESSVVTAELVLTSCQPGLALITSLLARGTILKQGATDAANPTPPSAADIQQWYVRCSLLSARTDHSTGTKHS